MAKPTNGTTQAGGRVTPEPTDELLGTWLFNETLVKTGSDDAYRDQVEFTCAGVTYGSFEIYFPSFDGEGVEAIEFEDYDTGDVIKVYGYYEGENNEIIGPEWFDENYRTITITDTSSLTNREEFTTWFKANATKQDGAI